MEIDSALPLSAMLTTHVWTHRSPAEKKAPPRNVHSPAKDDVADDDQGRRAAAERLRVRGLFCLQLSHVCPVVQCDCIPPLLGRLATMFDQCLACEV